MTAPALIPQVWVHEARASQLADTVAVLAGIADDDTLPTKTRQAAQTGRLLLEVIATQLGEEITRAEIAATGVTIASPEVVQQALSAAGIHLVPEAPTDA